MRTTNVYTYHELPDSIKPKVREQIREVLRDIAEIDHEVSYWTEQLENLGFYEVDISYSVYHGQGDGASFSGFISEKDVCKILDIQPTNRDGCVKLYRTEHRYSHENTVSMLGVDEPSDIFLDKHYEAFDEWRVAKCREIHASLEAAWKAEYDDEAIDAFIDSNEPEYVLTHDGRALPFN